MNLIALSPEEIIRQYRVTYSNDRAFIFGTKGKEKTFSEGSILISGGSAGTVCAIMIKTWTFGHLSQEQIDAFRLVAFPEVTGW